MNTDFDATMLNNEGVNDINITGTDDTILSNGLPATNESSDEATEYDNAESAQETPDPDKRKIMTTRLAIAGASAALVGGAFVVGNMIFGGKDANASTTSGKANIPAADQKQDDANDEIVNTVATDEVVTTDTTDEVVTTDTTDEVVTTIATDGEEPVANTDIFVPRIGEPARLSVSVNDNMSFDQAFAVARDEAGVGGIFVWHGKAYNTYTKEEWAALTPEQQATANESFDVLRATVQVDLAEDQYGGEAHDNTVDVTPEGGANVNVNNVNIHINVHRGGHSESPVVDNPGNTPEPNGEVPLQPVHTGNYVPAPGTAAEVATTVHDYMSFGEAFAAARDEVGSGGVFVWHGREYNTYTRSEWDSLSREQHAQFARSYQEARPAIDAELVAQAEYNHALENPTNPHDTVEVIELGEEGEVKEIVENNDITLDVDTEEAKLTIEHSTYDEQHDMTYSEVTVGDKTVTFVDIDNDKKFDFMVTDDNGDHNITPDEIADISNSGLTTDMLDASAGVYDLDA